MLFKKWTLNKLFNVIESKALSPVWFLEKSLLVLDHGSEFVE